MDLVFFSLMTSVIITTIGLGKAKKIPPPDNVEGGFVRKSPDEKVLANKNEKARITELTDSDRNRL